MSVYDLDVYKKLQAADRTAACKSVVVERGEVLEYAKYVIERTKDRLKGKAADEVKMPATAPLKLFGASLLQSPGVEWTWGDLISDLPDGVVRTDAS